MIPLSKRVQILRRNRVVRRRLQLLQPGFRGDVGGGAGGVQQVGAGIESLDDVWLTAFKAWGLWSDCRGIVPARR